MVSPTAKLLGISLLFHLLYSASIFDIYFTSPVVHPLRRFSADTVLQHINEGVQDGVATAKGASLERPADRLVLIVGDGLRADTLFKEHQAAMLPAWASVPLDADVALSPKKNWSTSAVSHVEHTKKSAETFFAAPHLRQTALERGAWGISHTRVPTESRPGHVALIAGMYEDVSAVTKGWKQNPIPFDSVFNQSSHTFSFGSPDILPMFAKGAHPGRVDMQMYDEDAEDFTTDASELDLWVLDQLRSVFRRAQDDPVLDRLLRAPETVFFLHLLGLDTTGHTYRPKSPEYIGNLMIVDAIVAEVERLFDEFYQGDNSRTTFLFTADHGMSNKGNHGDGEPDNTRTPVVAWGSGIRVPRAATSEQAWRDEQRQGDEYFRGWGKLDHTWREDVAQADLATLMSSLLRVKVPANSEGKLPLHYLNVTAEYGALASLANAMEVLEMYRVKHEERQRRMLRYKAFHGLHTPDQDFPGALHVARVQQCIVEEDYVGAVKHANDLIDLAVEGSRYLQTYDWLSLVSIILVGYLGSMLYSASFLASRYILPKEDVVQSAKRVQHPLGQMVVWSLTVLLFGKFAAEKAPIMYYTYTAFAAFYWNSVVRDGILLTLVSNLMAPQAATNAQDVVSNLLKSSFLRFTLSIAALEVMVIGYLNRLAWSAGFVVIGFVWPALGMSPDVKGRHEVLFIFWTVMCGICATFTLGSVDKEESIVHLIVSGLVFLAAGILVLQRTDLFLGQGKTMTPAETAGLRRTRQTLAFQLLVLVVSTCVSVSSSLNLQQKLGLPRHNQIIAWAVLALCFTVPFFYGFRRRHGEAQSASNRLAIVIFAFAPVFVLLSLRDETLFFASYIALLLLWAKLEGALFEERAYHSSHYNSSKEATSNGDTASSKRLSTRGLQKEDVRVAILFLFFLHVGFFGTGNIASISSFYLSPVYRLVPIFNPFLMAALLILKILVPFLVLASVLQRLCLTMPHALRIDGSRTRTTGHDLAGPPFLGADSVGGLGLHDAYAIVLLACLFTDVLAINFLLTVRTEGSWLEIGQSITHFVMSNLLQVFMLGLGALADFIVG